MTKAKAVKAPTIDSELEMTMRLIAREEQELRRQDPLALHDERDKAKEKLVQEGEKSDLIAALKNAAIRRMLYRWIVVKGGLYAADGHENTNLQAHCVGRRSLARDLHEAITEVDLGLWHQAESEAKSNRKSQENENGSNG